MTARRKLPTPLPTSVATPLLMSLAPLANASPRVRIKRKRVTPATPIRACLDRRKQILPVWLRLPRLVLESAREIVLPAFELVRRIGPLRTGADQSSHPNQFANPRRPFEPR